MADEHKKQVISHEDGVKILKRIDEMQESIANGDESTKLALSERADEMQKAVEEVTDIAKTMEADRVKFAEDQRRAALESGDKPLQRELRRFKGGYRAMKGDNDDYGSKTVAAPSIKNLIEGVMLQTGEIHEPKHEDIEHLRTLNDNALIAGTIMRANDPDGFQARGGMGGMETVKEMRRFAEDVFGKATTETVDTTDLANMVPTHFSSVLYDTVRLATPEMSLWQEITMPGKSLDLNVNLTDPESTAQPEVTTIAGANPFLDTNVQALDEQKVTLSAVKSRSRIVFSGEIDEDAIIAQIPWYRNMLIEGQSNGLGDAIVNGDVTGDLDDTTDSKTHFGKACPAAGVDARTLWDGLRLYARDNTATPSTQVDGATADLSSALIGSVWEKMGEYGVDGNDQLVTICSPTSYLKLVQDSNFITKDLMGELATLLTGSIGKVWNIPVVVSRRYPQNMTGTDEKIGGDATTFDETGAILVRRDKMVLGNRRRMTMGMESYGATDAKDIYLFWRGDFKALMPATVPWIGSLIGLKTV